MVEYVKYERMIITRIFIINNVRIITTPYMNKSAHKK